MQKDDSSKMRSDEQDKANFATSDEVRNHTSLTTEQRPAETHNSITNPDDDIAENRVATSLDDE